MSTEYESHGEIPSYGMLKGITARLSGTTTIALLESILAELTKIRQALVPEPTTAPAPPECPYCHTSDFTPISTFDGPRLVCDHCGAQSEGQS